MERKIKEFASRIGMDDMDINIQKGAYLAKHIEKCPRCSNLLNYMNEIISHHANEELT